MLRLLPLLLLAACARQGASPYGGAGAVVGGPSLAPTHYYPPPGPPGDPWGPYIREAAARYGVPEQWIRAVMQQESGGEEQAVSPVGAMGLMQVMPETYEGLRERYGLGDDPYDPHNNILAGAAYIREMYDQFGAPGFLAAYNAGPDRVDSYLAGSAELPNETVHYLAAVTPNLGDSVPLSGPLAMYASARTGGAVGYSASVASLAAGCNLSLAYDPNHPCSSLERAAVASAPLQPALIQQAEVQQAGVGGCDLDVAYDPSRPCTSVGPAAAAVAAAVPQAAAAPVVVASAPPQAAAAPVVVASAPPQPAAAPIVVASAPPQPAAAPVVVASAPPAAQVVLASAPPQPPAAQVVVASALPPPAAAQATGGCDLNTAHDPDHPCRPAPRQTASYTQLASAEGGCDPDLAFDPDRPCQAESTVSLPVTAPPRDRLLASAAPGSPGSHLLAIPVRDWAIQVGAFANPRLARAVAENARAQAPGQLRSATLALPPTPNGRTIVYRARLAHLSASAASDACWRLNQRQLPCVVVQPDRT
ncbi:MAG: transglycosylase SLT domain-containing protein [Stellaceae bacterium]